VLAMFIWQDTQKRFERAEDYYKTVIQQGIYSTDPEVRRRAKHALKRMNDNS
jgi:hypothetical protein